MNVAKIIEQLQEIKAAYPVLTNDEVLKILELHLIGRVK